MKIAIKAKVKMKAKPDELKGKTVHVDPGTIKVKVKGEDVKKNKKGKAK